MKGVLILIIYGHSDKPMISTRLNIVHEEKHKITVGILLNSLKKLDYVFDHAFLLSVPKFSVHSGIAKLK